MPYKFLIFVFVGGIATVIQYIVMILLIELSLCNVLFASVISYCIGAIVNYILNYHFTFKATQPHIAIFPKFLVTAIIGLIINTIIINYLMQFNYLHYLFAQGIATVLVLIWNYLVNNYWSFKAKTRTENAK